jgi:hypothetical protein
VLVLLAAAMLGLVGLRVWKEKQHDEAVSRAAAYQAAGNYVEARDLYLSLNMEAEAAECEALRVQQELKNAYTAAEAQLKAGEYLDAKDAFLALGDYEDAKTRALECDYRRAESYADADRLSEAISLLGTLTDYPGAETLLKTCRDRLYDQALEATYACRLDEAVQRWNELGDYRDLLTDEAADKFAVTLPSGGFRWLLCDFTREWQA